MQDYQQIGTTVGVWRLKPETSGQFGQDVVVSEVLTQEEIDKRVKELAKQYGEISREKLAEEADRLGIKYDSNIVLFSVAGEAAFNHFVQTILKDVSTTNFPTSYVKKFPKVRMWGAIDRATNLNRSKWSRLRKGDILLFFREKKYVTKMVIDGTEDNYDIAKMIWGEKIDHETMNVESRPGETWQLIMYGSSENVTQTNVSYQDLNKLLGYEEKFMPTRIMDFTIVSELRVKKLRAKYGSIQKALESIGL